MADAVKFYPITPGEKITLTTSLTQTGVPMNVQLPLETDDELTIRALRRDFLDRIREVPVLRQRNLVKNPSAEVNTTGWQTNLSGTSGWSLTRSQLVPAHSGDWCFRLSGGTTGSAASRASILQTTAYRHPTLGGSPNKYTSFCWAWNGSPDTYRGFKVGTVWYRADNSQASIYEGSTQFLPPGMWVKVPVMNGQPPDDVVWGAVRMSVVEPVAGESYYFDSAFAAKTEWRQPDEEYFDGDSGIFHSWEGTAHDSTSVEHW
jgi:hypothetical protein